MFCESFSDKVIEHFMCPRNVGSMPDADAIGSCGDPGCGDSLTLYIKVKDNVITDISFLVFGCVAAIASSSMTTELAKGKTLEEALRITDNDIADALDGLPENKIHCSVLGATALKNAIENYFAQTANHAVG
jgi:nitrogen fixation NifU-like protein